MTEKKFIALSIKKLLNEGIKSFPEDFNSIKEYEVLDLPQKPLQLGTELFGKIEIITSDGTVVHSADDYTYAKYLIYAARRQNGRLKIPLNKNELRSLVAGYEKYLDGIIISLNSEYRKIFGAEQNPGTAVNEIFRALNLVRY